jgi:hypothetical protein
MFASLHNVLYIPNPSIIAANRAKGIKMKILVLRPMYTLRSITYKIVTVLINYDTKSAFSIWILQ